MRGAAPSRAALVGVLLLAASAQAGTYTLEAETWTRPRSGDALLALEPVRALLSEFDDTAAARVEIRYPGGEAGLLWALELQDWLVSFGIPSARIRTVAGSGVPDSVQLVVERGTGR